MRSHIWIIILTSFLVSVGLLMVGDASFVDAVSDFGNKWHYFLYQSIWALIGTLILILAACIPIGNLERWGQIIFTVSITLLILVLKIGRAHV